MYVEASGRRAGDKTQLMTFPLSASKYEACKIMFYYYMEGLGEGSLNVYTKSTVTNITQLELSLKGDHGLGWKQVELDLSHRSDGQFIIIFEGNKRR